MLKNSRTQKGFTLIELLVVIAIIGILASTILGAVQNARLKGQNASIKAHMDGIRKQASLFYDDAGQVYNDGVGESVCVNTESDTLKGVANIVTAADSLNFSGLALCNDAVDAWAAAVQLVGDSSAEYYCVDSAGFVGEITGVVGGTNPEDFSATDVSCQ